MPTPESPLPAPRRRSARLTPEAVRRRQFPRTPLGRRGYLEPDVDRFRILVADEIAYSDAEKAELRAEIDRLRNYFRDHRIDPRATSDAGPGHRSPGAAGARVNGSPAGAGAAGGAGPGAGPDAGPGRRLTTSVPSVEAVNLMSLAQQAADQHIAQAEHYAREMVGDARKQYEQILLVAQARAEEAVEEATRAADAARAAGATSAETADLEAKISYLRTYAEVTQVQMRSILQALGAELERLAPPPHPFELDAPDGLRLALDQRS